MIERYKGLIENGGGRSTASRSGVVARRPYPINNLVKAHYVLFNMEADQAVLNELVEGFRFNDAVLRTWSCAATKPTPSSR